MNKPILLVEDDANDVFFMRRVMEKAGIPNAVQVARDGREAVDYLGGADGFADRGRFPLPCLVLLDLKLPRMTGLEVLQWIRLQPEFTAVIVIVLTSSKLALDVDAAYRLGANSYLVKPSNPDGLMEMVTSLKDFWLEQNQWPPGPERMGLASGVNTP